MNEKDIEFLLKTIASGMRILSTRLLLILTLLLTFSLFVWAAYQPDYWRLGTATIFALAVFLPVRSLDAKGVTEERKSNE